MRIDLKKYCDELGYWVEAFKPFICSASIPLLCRIKDDLESGRDNLGRNQFSWKIDRPIWTKVADKYDGPNRTPHVVKVGWQFHSKFSHSGNRRKSNEWIVEEMVTHTRVHLSRDDARILHFHHDLKNRNQIGPHVHMQFSEEFLSSGKRAPIAVPRFPAAVLLPTDCFDFALSEFFPYDWPKAQSDVYNVNALKSRQEARLKEFSLALTASWRKNPKRTPVSMAQESDFSAVQIA